MTAVTGLTSRQQQVAARLAAGRTNREIAEEHGVSVKTVDTHRSQILKRLGLRNNSDITRYALRAGWLVGEALTDERRAATALVLARADEHLPDSSVAHALCEAAAAIARGEHLAAWQSGQLDELKLRAGALAAGAGGAG